MTRPNYLIIGAQKSGTTSLARWIGTHPEVGMTAAKEVHFFSDTEKYKKGMDWYEQSFETLAGRVAIGEATPEYLYRAEAPQRIAESLGWIRCIAVLRNPVDRAYSAYLHGKRIGYKSRTFEDALADEDRNLARGQWGWGSLVDRGRYLRQLQRYERRFGRDAVHVLLHEDVRDTPDLALEAVFRFLGVDETHRPDRYIRYNVAKESLLPPAMRKRMNKLDRSVMKLRLMRITTRVVEPEPMKPATRAALVERFRTENDALQSWLGRDLSHWNA